MSSSKRIRKEMSVSQKPSESEEREPKFDILFQEKKREPTISEQKTSNPTKMSDHLPEYGSPDWQKFVLSNLYPEELSDGYPRCFGLRRLANKILGPIVRQGVETLSVIPQMTEDGKSSRAVTVVYNISIQWKLDTTVPYVIDMSKPEYPTPLYVERKFSGVADCIEDVSSPFGRHPAASAETKAESRALKKALGLSILTAEEKISGYDDTTISSVEERRGVSESKITTQLVNFINAKLANMGLNHDSVIDEYCKNTLGCDVKPLSEFTISEGQTLFNNINNLQQNR